ncbi:MAG TPA: DUF4118 domain-containing protein, partial [Burkholderiales bacterium]|nr:DUF4118 domain-containing protein [Burkholderiales bacterium]
MGSGPAAPKHASAGGRAAGIAWRAYGVALLACGSTAALALPLGDYLDLANIVMLFLLTVVLVAVRLGRGPAVMAAFLSVALFDFFLVPPRLSFAVNDIQYLLTFAVMLIVALIIGQLAAGLKHQADLASTRERRTLALYEMSRELAGALQSGQVVDIARRFLREVVGARAQVLLTNRDGELVLPPGDAGFEQYVNLHVARTALTNGACADLDADCAVGYFALKAP